MHILKIKQEKKLIKSFNFLKEVDIAHRKLEKNINKIKVKKIQNIKKKNIFLVDLSNNITNCFKIRGALNEIKSLNTKKIKFLCAASSGSFGISVALGAKLHKKRSVIFAPKNLIASKKKLLKRFGAKIIFSKDYEESKILAKNFSKKKKCIFVDGLGKNVIIGNATYIKELYEDYIVKLKKKIAIVVPLGIGSLAIPTGMFLKKKKVNFDLFLVEPENYGKLYCNFKKVKFLNFNQTLADGAAVKVLPRSTIVSLKNLAKYVVILNEKEIQDSMHDIKKKVYFKKTIEGAGALSYGSYMHGKKYFKKYESVFLFITGKNT
jgi:threonine dehydratase